MRKCVYVGNTAQNPLLLLGVTPMHSVLMTSSVALLSFAFLISSFSTVATHNIHLKLCPSNKDYKEFTLFSA